MDNLSWEPVLKWASPEVSVECTEGRGWLVSPSPGTVGPRPLQALTCQGCKGTERASEIESVTWSQLLNFQSLSFPIHKMKEQLLGWSPGDEGARV